MSFFKQAWFWIIIFSLIFSGVILFFGQENIFPGREIAITLNEEKMNLREFNVILKQIEESEKEAGRDVSGDYREEVIKKAVEAAIEKLLFFSYIKSKNISVTEEDIDIFYEDIFLEYPEVKTKEDFLKMWEEKGLTEGEVEKEVEIAVKYEKMYEERLNEVSVTEEEVQDAYDDYLLWAEEAGVSKEDVMSFEEIKEELRDLVAQEKAGIFIEKEIEEFKKKSEIEVFI